MRAYILIFLLGVLSARAMGQIHFVADLDTNVSSSSPASLTVFNNGLYFTTLKGNTRTLWRYDNNGLQKVISPLPGMFFGSPRYPVVNNQLILPGFDSKNQTFPSLWKISNTGTLSEITDTLFVGWPHFYSSVNGGVVYFNANQGIYSYNLNTNVISRIGKTLPKIFSTQGDSLDYISDLIYYNNAVYFIGHPNPSMFNALFKIDLSTNSVTQVIDTVSNLVVGDDNRLYFLSTVNGVTEVFVINQNNSPVRLTFLGNTGGSVFSEVIKWGNAIYFAGRHSSLGVELMKCDLANQTTSLVKDINPGGVHSHSQPHHFTVYGNKLCFRATDSTHGTEFWTSDGTAAGTKLIMDLVPGLGSGSSSVSYFNRFNNLAVFNNHLYFSAFDSTHGEELFRFSDPASIQAVSLVNSIKIFPNPAQSHINIECDLVKSVDANITVFDLSGKRVYSSPVTSFSFGVNNIVVPTESFVPGVYSYSLKTDKQEFLASGNFVKQ
jgi:ELWxxDGT repeat protein